MFFILNLVLGFDGESIQLAGDLEASSWTQDFGFS